MNYEKLKRNKTLFYRCTGLTLKKFDELFVLFKKCYIKDEIKRSSAIKRIRKKGAGPKFKYDLQDRLLIVLLYYRMYMTQEFLGLIFQLDDSNISRTITRLTPLLAQIFRIPEKRVKLSAAEEESVLRFFIDGTEQPILRPQNSKTQKKYYSGKKKRHTIKYQVITQDGKTIEAISKSFCGKTHDKKMYDETNIKLPPNAKKIGDTGYQGTDLIHPVKKKRGKSLSKSQKKYNRKISSLRIVAEHAICKMKRYRIAKEVFRNRRNDHNLHIKNIAGLVNFQMA